MKKIIRTFIDIVFDLKKINTMNKQVLEYLVLKSNNHFIFQVPHPDFLKTNKLSRQEKDLFSELSLVEFDQGCEVVLFKTIDGKIGTIGLEFTGWYRERAPSLSIKLTDSIQIEGILY